MTAKIKFTIQSLDRRVLVAGVIIVMIALVARTIPGPRTIDDSYITFRYARNLLSGNGFVYNPGQRVLGTTTPLYTGIMAFLGLFTGGANAPFPTLALIVNALADAATCLLLIVIGLALKKPRVGLAAALVWSVLPYSVTFAIGGLETSVYVFLLTSTMYAHLTRRPIWTVVLAALSFLTRPDALILVGLIALDRLFQIIKNRRSSDDPAFPPFTGKEVITALLPVTLWLTFSTLYFGTLLPHSIAAKAVAYQLPEYSALIRLIQHYATPFMGSETFGITMIAVGLFLYPFLSIIGGRQAISVSARIWPWFFYPLCYLIVFAIPNPLIFRWYLTPPLPAYIFFILLGADQILSPLLTEKRATFRTWAAKLVYLFIIPLLPVFLLLRTWTLTPDHGLATPAPNMAWYQLELLYQQAGEFVKADALIRTRQPVLAAGDVGVLGYVSGARILDTVGLNSPESIPYYPTDPSYYVNAYAVSPDLILDQQPDYVVLLEVYGRKGLFIHPDFVENYDLLLKIPTDIYDSDGMLVFERKSR